MKPTDLSSRPLGSFAKQTLRAGMCASIAATVLAAAPAVPGQTLTNTYNFSSTIDITTADSSYYLNFSLLDQLMLVPGSLVGSGASFDSPASTLYFAFNPPANDPGKQGDGFDDPCQGVSFNLITLSPTQDTLAISGDDCGLEIDLTYSSSLFPGNALTSADITHALNSPSLIQSSSSSLFGGAFGDSSHVTEVAPAPEPSAFVLTLGGLAALVGLHRFRRNIPGR